MKQDIARIQRRWVLLQEWIWPLDHLSREPITQKCALPHTDVCWPLLIIDFVLTFYCFADTYTLCSFPVLFLLHQDSNLDRPIAPWASLPPPGLEPGSLGWEPSILTSQTMADWKKAKKIDSLEIFIYILECTDEVNSRRRQVRFEFRSSEHALWCYDIHYVVKVRELRWYALDRFCIMTRPRLEPEFSGSGDRRLIHWANGPSG